MGRRAARWGYLLIPAFLSVASPLSAQEGAATRPRVEINTTEGRMVVELYNETPVHRDNFLKLVREHYYDSTLIHRVVPGFVMQGGDPLSRNAPDHHMVLGRGGPGYTLQPEIDRSFIDRKGALVAAQPTEEPNPEKRSHGSQFFLVDGRTWSPSDLRMLAQRRNAADPGLDVAYTPEQVQAYATSGGAPHLDGNYTVFGQLVEGTDVLDRITALPCDVQDRPLTDVRIWMRVLP